MVRVPGRTPTLGETAERRCAQAWGLRRGTGCPITGRPRAPSPLRGLSGSSLMEEEIPAPGDQSPCPCQRSRPGRERVSPGTRANTGWALGLSRAEVREWTWPPGSSGEISLRLPHLSTASCLEQGEEATRAKSMKSWKLRLRKGGHTCPGNEMNSGRRLFPPVAMVMRGGARRETGLSLSRTWTGTGICAKDACGLGTRDQESRPRPPPQTWGSRPPAPPPSDPGVQALPSSSDLGVQVPCPTPLRPRGPRLSDPLLIYT